MEGERRERLARQAYVVAEHFLSRWRDPLTRSGREEWAQEAACRALGRIEHLRDPDCFAAYVRTIARRLRARALRPRSRPRALSLEADDKQLEKVYARECTVDVLRIGSCLIERAWLIDQVADLVDRLPPTSRELVRAYYDGFSCAELSVRTGLPEHSVRTRIHRGRNLVRTELLDRVRAGEQGTTDGRVPVMHRRKPR